MPLHAGVKILNLLIILGDRSIFSFSDIFPFNTGTNKEIRTGIVHIPSIRNLTHKLVLHATYVHYTISEKYTASVSSDRPQNILLIGLILFH